MTSKGYVLVRREGHHKAVVVAVSVNVFFFREASLDCFVGLISELLAGCGPLLVKAPKSQVDAIAQNRFDRPEAMLSTWAVGVDHFPDGPDPDIDLIRPLKSLLHRAVAAGYGEEELAAVIKVLRAQTP